jgi:hypothetical protein
MSSLGGGWTLVAFSWPNVSPATPFGWTVATGGPLQFDGPYSLGPTSLALSFSEIVATTADFAWYSHAYGLPDLSQGFFDDNITGAAEHDHYADPCGDFSSTGAYFGKTADQDLYWVDGNNLDVPEGLSANGFTYGVNTCTESALDGEQGAIWVR